jgi:S-formylglutathione hydrolase FrmB
MGYGHGGVSLLDGWFPITLQLVAAFALGAAISVWKKRWWAIWIPAAVAVGVAVLLVAMWYEHTEGLASDPPPSLLWWWVAIFGFAVAVLLFGVRRFSWWRRGVALLAIALSFASAALVLNQWVGYYTTVQEAWGQLTQGPLPDQVDRSKLDSYRGKPLTTGMVVSITTPKDQSHFTHRTEYVYLPPEWFAGPTPPQLPVIMMIAGEFNTPQDWLRTGNAIQTVDHYAAQNGGKAPILVFPDVGGSFNNDTECVNGSRGNVATHLTDEVRPYVVKNFDAAPGGKNWGVIGWSMGGTCALDLAVMHPDLFTAFADIAGDAAPNAGTKDQTVDRLFGGSVNDYNAFDPALVMAKHGPYTGVWGWFDDSSGKNDPRAKRFQAYLQSHPHLPHRGHAGGGNGLGGRDNAGFQKPGSELAAAETLCKEAKAVNIDCAVHTHDGGHTWQFAESAFATILGPMSAQIGV